ncbi:MAG: C40 family peptidase [Gemmatimonadaceae bacterium]|nr:C40 family peptidase [Gemmatimonadaceae bacterium]
MLFRSAGFCAVLGCLAQPAPAYAQINRSSITLGDIERAVHIGRVILDATGNRPNRSPRPTTRRDRATDEAIAVAGAVISTRSASRTARRAVATGDDYVGVPYVWGGSTPRGFDCSGFVQYVYREHGVRLPRTSRQMARAGQALRANVGALREGDLMLFRGRNGVIGHVALYAGRNRILHSSSSGNGVRYDDLSSKRGRYYRTHLVAARRVTENGRSLVQALSLLYKEKPFDYFDPPDEAPRPR